jgi:hypothetical protein
MASEPTPVKVQKLGHVVFTVTDIERTHRSSGPRSWAFHVSDRNERGMVFLQQRVRPSHRRAGAGGIPHTTPATRGTAPVPHCALEVGTVSELFKIRDFPPGGRACPSTTRAGVDPAVNPGIEFEDPDGFRIESLRLDGSDRRGRQEPPGGAVAPRQDPRGGRGQSPARRHSIDEANAAPNRGKEQDTMDGAESGRPGAGDVEHIRGSGRPNHGLWQAPDSVALSRGVASSGANSTAIRATRSCT